MPASMAPAILGRLPESLMPTLRGAPGSQAGEAHIAGVLMDDNKSMVSMMAAHMSDAGRMMRHNKPPSLTTVRGLMEAIRWLDKQRRSALERLNTVEGRLFEVAGETPTVPMSLQDALIEFCSWLQVDGIPGVEFDVNQDRYVEMARSFIASYADSFPDRQLPGVRPTPHQLEEEL
jgi:hypothetical protein